MSARMTKFAAVLIGATVIGSPVALSAQTVQTSQMHQTRAGYVVGTSYLNARTGPGTQFNVVTTLAPGTPVSEISRQGGWVQVSANGSAPLWVYGSYLKPISTTQQGAQPGLKVIPEAKPDPSKPAFEGSYPLVIRP